MFKKIIFFIFLPLLVSLNAAHVYYEIEDADTLIFNNSTIVKENEIIRLYENDNCKHLTVFDTTFHTIKYEFENKEENSEVTIDQQDSKIVLKGILKGKEIESEFVNDEIKWSQSITYTLHRFMLSDKEQEIFRIFRPDNFKPIEFKAVKGEEDTLQINGTEIPVQKIKLRLNGIKSIFWKGEYNFRIPDGLFIKYKGKNGGPGSPETTIILKE